MTAFEQAVTGAALDMEAWRAASFRDAGLMPVDLEVRREAGGAMVMRSRIPLAAHDWNLPRAFAAVAGLPENLPEGWHARLMPDHRIRIEAEAPMDCPSNVIELVSAMVRFALALDPYLDTLEAEGAA